MALRPVNVKITGDTSQLDAALGQAGRQLRGFATAAAAAGTLVVGALAAMTAQGLAAVDANTKLARSLDGNVNSLRAVQIAAGYAGVSVAEANTALQQMNRELVRAREAGTPAQEALAKLGLRARDLENLDLDDRLATIADRMRGLGISSAEASDILRDLGVRSRNMALLLTQGGDAIRSARDEVRSFGLELSRVETDQIEKTNDAIARMGLVFESLRNRLAAEVAPALQVAADQFNRIAQSSQVQDAVQRLADSFGNLAQIILSEDFLTTAAAGLTGIANIAAVAAESAVTLSQNIEAVTIAFAGLAIGAAALGGPLTVVIGALAAALGGIAVWRSRTEDMAAGSDAAREAQDALNKALGTFHETAAPSAAAAAIDAANANYQLAESAIAAAEAELAKRRAQQKAFEGGVQTARRQGLQGRADEMAADAARNLADAEAALESARVARDRTARQVTGSMSLGTISLGGQDDESDESGFEPIELPSFGGGGGAVSAAEGIHDELEEMERKHQERMNAIREAGADNAFSTVVGAGQEILGAIGQNNEKAAKAAKSLGALEAMVNAYRAASQALSDPDLPWYAKVGAAASLLATGIGFANSIKSLSDSGSGGGGGGGVSGGGRGATPAAAAQGPLDVRLSGLGANDIISGADVGNLLDRLNDEAGDRGFRILVAR